MVYYADHQCRLGKGVVVMVLITMLGVIELAATPPPPCVFFVLQLRCALQYIECSRTNVLCIPPVLRGGATYLTSVTVPYRYPCDCSILTPMCDTTYVIRLPGMTSIYWWDRRAGPLDILRTLYGVG